LALELIVMHDSIQIPVDSYNRTLIY
jgi:hypothetical protein